MTPETQNKLSNLRLKKTVFALTVTAAFLQGGISLGISLSTLAWITGLAMAAFFVAMSVKLVRETEGDEERMQVKMKALAFNRWLRNRATESSKFLAWGFIAAHWITLPFDGVIAGMSYIMYRTWLNVDAYAQAVPEDEWEALYAAFEADAQED